MHYMYDVLLSLIHIWQEGGHKNEVADQETVGSEEYQADVHTLRMPLKNPNDRYQEAEDVYKRQVIKIGRAHV